MRVLFITNSATERCGVRVYGELWMAHLRQAGVEIDEWDGTYQSIQARRTDDWDGYLPRYLDHYDLLHLNWDPQAINHYVPPHFGTAVPPLSVFLHDVPPNSTCPVAGIADLLLAHEPGEGIVRIDHAVPTYRSSVPILAARPSSQLIVGTSGIRDDPGVALVEQVCQRNGWIHNRNKRWLTTEEEIDRLAKSDVNVCWYATSGRGKSLAAMLMVAAQRPLVLSGSTMFSALRGYWPTQTRTHDALHQPTAWYHDLDHLTGVIQGAAHRGSRPTYAADALSWTRCAQQIKALWEGVVRGEA